MKKFVNLHRHDDYSNGNMFEVVTKYSDYLDQDIKDGVNSFCITNHGNISGWLKRKEAADKNGLKYIHGIEAYVTEELDKKLNDNYHLILLAKNWEGVKEINTLSSKSFGGRGLNNGDYHFYRRPRMSREEIFNTSDNVLILTACLGSPIWQTYKNNYKEEHNRWIDFFAKNKHRVWLEVQPHNTKEQKMYNKMLLDLADKHGMNIVATNDVHALNQEHEEIRNLLQKVKNSFYEPEEGEEKEELWQKNTEEMVESFKLQGVLSDSQIEKAINNTQAICNQVESFEVNRDIRYPKIYDDSEKVFQDAIKTGLKRRGIDKLSKEEQKTYIQRVNKEYKTFKAIGSIDFMLLEWNVSQWIVNHNMYTGPGRGSAAGSLSSYLLEITHLDPVKHNLSFERFCNIQRISLSDIDSDMYSEDRVKVQKYLLNHPDLHCAKIMTVGTYALKGAIRDLGNALGYSMFERMEISNALIEENGETIIPQELYESHKELFDYAKKIDGVINNFGIHPAGLLIFSEPLEDIVGTMMLKDFEYPVTQLNMKEIDGLNLVKLDLLGLDNVGLMNKTEELAGLEHLTPQSNIIDFNDDNVIKSIAEDNTAIFQFEKKRSQKLLQDMFDPQVLEKIRKVNPDSTYVELLSLLTAALRPSGESYLEDVVSGNFTDNDSEILNDFLKDTQGNLVYQEQQTEFLVKFCGWTESEADLIRRGIGKKSYEIMNNEVPKIKPSFVKTMVEKYNDTPEHADKIADKFIQVFMDSVNYGFNKSHAYAYSYISYISAWLRYYYPLEFCTAALQIWKDNQEKTNSIITYAKKQGIDIKAPRFRRSKGDYFFDKETNSIYQGTAPIKGMNARAGDDLFSMRDVEFDDWLDFLLYIKDGSMITIDGTEYKMHLLFTKFTEEEIKQLDKDIKANPDKYEIKRNPYSSLDKRNMEPLIRLGYFAEFGKPAKLLATYLLFLEKYKPNNKTYAGKYKNFQLVKDFWENQEVEDFKIAEELETELYYTGRVTKSFEKIPAKYGFVTAIDVKKTRSTAQVFNIRSGKMVEIKVGSRLFKNVPFEQGDIIEIREGGYKPKSELVSGKWVKSKTKKEYWVTSLFMFHKNKMFGKKK